MRLLLTAVFVSFGLILFAAPERLVEPPRPADPIRNAADASVLVMAEPMAGSGVCFHNGPHAFVWTDAHVVANRKRSEAVADAVTGRLGVRVWFQDDVEGGRKVGSVRALAKIVRYSDVHDVALLKVHKKFPLKSVRFADEVPSQGDSVFHVGSMAGVPGLGSFSAGHVSRVGRLRAATVGGHTDTDEPMVYDQVSLVAHPGSSGGGVFRYSDGACVGLIVEFLRPGAHGSLMTNPARRMRQFARESRCEWAMDDRIPVPAEDLELPFSDRFIPIAEEGK